jgi:hypothetical protein
MTRFVTRCALSNISSSDTFYIVRQARHKTKTKAGKRSNEDEHLLTDEYGAFKVEVKKKRLYFTIKQHRFSLVFASKSGTLYYADLGTLNDEQQPSLVVFPPEQSEDLKAALKMEKVLSYLADFTTEVDLKSPNSTLIPIKSGLSLYKAEWKALSLADFQIPVMYALWDEVVDKLKETSLNVVNTRQDGPNCPSKDPMNPLPSEVVHHMLLPQTSKVSIKDYRKVTKSIINCFKDDFPPAPSSAEKSEQDTEYEDVSSGESSDRIENPPKSDRFVSKTSREIGPGKNGSQVVGSVSQDFAADTITFTFPEHFNDFDRAILNVLSYYEDIDFDDPLYNTGYYWFLLHCVGKSVNVWGSLGVLESFSIGELVAFCLCVDQYLRAEGNDLCDQKHMLWAIQDVLTKAIGIINVGTS